MTIYVARHGQTIWNAENKICGTTDIPLTEKGIKQAEELALQVKDKKVEIILSSPMKRAVTTSCIVSKKCGIPIVTDVSLIEQDYGIYEGADRNNEDFLANKRNFVYRYPNGESMMQTAVRVYSFLNEIKQRYADRNLLIISHGGICRIIKTYFDDMTNEEFFRYNIQNCQLEEYHT